MSYAVQVSPKARLLFAEANAWWIENRPKAPSLVTDEVARLFALLADSPKIGVVYRRLEGVEVRRIRLRRTPYHLYYRVDDDRQEVEVLAIWSAARGEGPEL